MLSFVLAVIILINAWCCYARECDGVRSMMNLNAPIYDQAIWCANENNGLCVGPGRLYYGSGETWAYKDLNVGEGISCSNSAFGCDPLPGIAKKCYTACPNNEYLYNQGSVTLCATEKDSRRCRAPDHEGRRVYYGDFKRGQQFAFRDLLPGESIQCRTINFDGCDPVPNVSKSCYSLVDISDVICLCFLYTTHVSGDFSDMR